MTVSQRTDAPFRAQRWVELYNVGDTTIPPFGVCEIVAPGSERPEQGSAYTPGDGRTALHVRRPTRDNACATVVNGPCEILVGKYAHVGTMDDPMLAMVASSSYTTNTTVGTQTDSYYLHHGKCGYIIIGDYDVGTQTMRVKRWEDCGKSSLVAKMIDCHKPGMTSATATPQRWNSQTKCWEDDPNATTITICDNMRWLLALPGECVSLERDSNCESEGTGCYRPAFPYGLTRRVKVTSMIDDGECALVTIMRGNNPCADEASECDILACNTSKRKLGCDADEYATFHATPGQCCLGPPECYGWLVANARPLRAIATATAPVCGGEVPITNISYIDVCNWEHREPPTTADNPMTLLACENKPVELGWNDCLCRWQITQVPDEELPDYMLDIRCKPDSCAVQKKTALYRYSGHFCRCADQGEVWDDTELQGEYIDVVIGGETSTSTGDPTSVLTNASCDSGSCGMSFDTIGLSQKTLTLKTKSVCVFCQKSVMDDGADVDVSGLVGIGGAGDPVTLTGEYVNVVGDASFDCSSGCSSPSISYKRLCVLCGTDAANAPANKSLPVATVDVLDAFGKSSTQDSSGNILTCGLSATKRSICFIGCDMGAGVADTVAFDSIEPLTDGAFDCTTCPEFTASTTACFVLCASASETVWSPESCECDPCEEPSA